VVPKWLSDFTAEERAAVLRGDDSRCPLFLVNEFRKGYAPGDEPPGLEERAYLVWLYCGGKVDPVKPVYAEDTM
jgi:hypothetical protein